MITLNLHNLRYNNRKGKNYKHVHVSYVFHYPPKDHYSKKPFPIVFYQTHMRSVALLRPVNSNNVQGFSSHYHHLHRSQQKLLDLSNYKSYFFARRPQRKERIMVIDKAAATSFSMGIVPLYLFSLVSGRKYIMDKKREKNTIIPRNILNMFDIFIPTNLAFKT